MMMPRRQPEPVRKALAPGATGDIPRLTAADGRPSRCGRGGEPSSAKMLTECWIMFRPLPLVAPCSPTGCLPVMRDDPTGTGHRSALAQGDGQQRASHLVVSRFVDHQPWHRQSVILRRQGVTIDRDVMGRWSASWPG
jgi:hypothetical protein